MSTITIDQLLRNAALKKDRTFNSLFAAYASTQRRGCGGCRKKRSDMTTCFTLLRALIVNKRELLEREFDIPPSASLSVSGIGDSFGIRVK